MKSTTMNAVRTLLQGGCLLSLPMFCAATRAHDVDANSPRGAVEPVWERSRTDSARESVHGAATKAVETRDEPAPYREMVTEGTREYNAGRFAEARSLFAHAHREFPNARTYRGLGMVAFEMRNYPESVDLLERALASEVRALDESMRSSTHKLLQRARSFVARLEVEVRPANARVYVDGAELASLGRAITVPVGDHTVLLSATGYLPETRRLQLTGGEYELLSVELISTRSSAGQKESSRARPLYKNGWLWTGVGVVAAGIATAVSLTLTRERRSEVDSTVPWVMGE